MNDNQNPNRELNGQTEHETHIPAIAFLVVLTGVIAVAVASMSTPVSQSPAEVQQTQTQDEQDSVEYVEAKKAESTDDMPSGIFFGDSELVQNRVVNLGGNRQRIVVYDTEVAPQELMSQYRSWFSENGYELSQESTDNAGGSIVANNGEEEVIVVLNQNGSESGARVQFNYIAEASI